MRSTITAFALATLAGLGAGCTQRGHAMTPWDDDARAATNRWAVRSVFDDQATRSVETRSVLYPAHFVPGTAMLTERGRREARTIADSLARSGGGAVHLPAGSETPGLYAARRDAVVAAMTPTLESAGVAPSSLVVLDRDPELEGVASAAARAAYLAPSSETPYDVHGSARDD